MPTLQTYSDLQTQLTGYLQREDLTAQYGIFVTLFEAYANRRLRTRQQETTAILTPAMTVTVSNASAGASNGQGGNLVRLTVSDTEPPFSSDQVTVSGIVGTTEANGIFNINLVDENDIDLIDSNFVNPYISGGSISDVGVVALPADYLAWRSCIWLGSPIRDLDYVEPDIMASRFPDIPIDWPSEFTIENGVLRVMPQDPTPLKFLYYQAIPSIITASSGTNWLMTAHPDLYLFGTLAEVQGFTVDPEKLALWKMRRDELLEEVIQLSAKTRAPSNIRVLGPTP